MTKNEERLSKLFKELVPDMGKAESLAGELVRAINRIGYRFCNDGDMVNIAYGKENLQPAGPIPDCKRQPRNRRPDGCPFGKSSARMLTKRCWIPLRERSPTTSNRTQTSETSRPKTCGTSRMSKKTGMTAGWKKRKTAGTKRTTTRKITRTKKTTKPEKTHGACRKTAALFFYRNTHSSDFPSLCSIAA